MFRSPWRAVAILFLLGAALRLWVLLDLVPKDALRPSPRWEISAIAIAIAERGEFADPYAIPTGPTAHLPPIYPALMGLIYRIFGTGLAGGYVEWTLRLLTDAASFALLPWLAVRFGMPQRAGVIGGLVGSCVVLGGGHGESLTAVAMALLLVAFLRRWTRSEEPWWSSLLVGFAVGASFHLQPALLPVMLGCLGFELWWRRSGRRWIPAGVLVLGAVLACVPWAWRNHAVLGGHFFVRSNFGLELRMGNHDGATAHVDVMDAIEEFRHPRTHLEEARLARDLGEVEYMRRAQREAVDWIAANPAEFARLTGARFLHVWFGPAHQPEIAAATTLLTLLALVGAWRIFPKISVPQRAAVLLPLVGYPLVYYVVVYMGRYRSPLNWLFFLLAGAALTSPRGTDPRR